MTLESRINQNRYTGNDSATQFAFTFKVWKKDQVLVYVGDGSSEQEVSSQCTITLTASGGTVEFPFAPSSGTIIVIKRNMPYVQEDDYRNGTRFDAEEIEDRFDQDCAERQDLKLDVGRAIKMPNTSTLSPDEFVRALLSAAQMMQDAGDVAGASLVRALGGLVYRSISAHLGDLVNIKDYGAVGDGLADDTAAWTAWQTALQSGGTGYIPAGTYLVNDEEKHFSEGCFGNGIDHVYPDLSTYATLDQASFISNTGPIIQHHRDFNGIESWAPLVNLSFESESDREESWDVNGTGAEGIHVRGTIRGVGNSHPIGIRSGMLCDLNGDGDCVALWGGCVKRDPEGGTNDSDTCAIHARCAVEGEGAGLCMATEHWAQCKKTQGTAGTNYSSFIDPGGIVCQHINPIGTNGMVQSCLLFNAGGDYGAWSALNINNNICKYNNSTLYPENTTFIKSPNIHPGACPESFIHVGWCPKHIRMTGAYDFNIYANHVVKSNNIADASSVIDIVDQRFSNSDETNKPITGICFKSNTYGGTPHVPAVGSVSTILFDLYSERGNVNIFYRAINQKSTHHVFIATDSSGVAAEALNVFHGTVRPGRDNEQQLGDSTKRWSTVFAGTGTINTSDERVKDNVAAPDEALMRAWGRVNFKVFQMKDAIAKKGAGAARLHVGVVAQQVISAFAEEGLDASRYGLLCHDAWEAEEPKIQHHWVVDEMEKRDDEGNLIEAEKGHYEDFVENPGREAGDIYSIRYDEALALECAYQRWRLEQLEERINQLANNS